MIESVKTAQQIAERLVHNVEQVIVGKPEAVQLAVIALIARGHLLIEDAPGVGKTMLARSLAKSVDCTFKRIQFTSDMLPSDITGVSVYDRKTDEFEFRPGPIMAQIVLADEINRATPKVQSALLECMDERQITVEGVTHRMPSPFHVLATENPLEYEGTFPLPETQLDRFMMRLNLGYPSQFDEITIMERQQFIHPIETLKPVADASDLLALQEAVVNIFVNGLIKEYIVAVVAETRHHPSLFLGASPRGSLALFRTVQARALMQGREFVLPDDVKVLAVPVLAHRLVLHPSNGSREHNARTVISEILEKIPVPGAMP